MLTYRTMTPQDEALALRLMDEFYHTDAVCTPPPPQLIGRNVAAAVDETNTALRGVLVYDGDTPVGYFMLTSFHSGEVGGTCIMIEQVYVSACCRGQGVGKQMMAWLRTEYPHALRFQLEVNEENPAAIHLYEKSGYEKNPYNTMFINV